MRKAYKFQIGQRVIISANNIWRKYGEVVDKTSHTIEIQWDGEKQTTWYEQDQYYRITLDKKKSNG